MKTIIEAIISSALLPPGSRVLVAVSGGADSMCLLHALWTNREKLKIDIIAGHYEHGLRGEESRRDQSFVESFCLEREIPFTSEHGDVCHYSSEHGIGLEEAARELRYAFLERVAEECCCDRIATAHHLQDNAETILFHLIRGSGSLGLQGITPLRGKIARPLLDVTRQEIEAYLNENRIAFVEDSSNASDDYSRNYIRHKILPLIREMNPAADEAICRAGVLLREDEAYLSAQADSFLQTYARETSLPCHELSLLPKAVSSRVIRKMCPYPLSFDHVQAVLDLTRKTELSWADIPGGKVRAEQGRLYFKEEPCVQPMKDRVLSPGDKIELSECGWRIQTEICFYSEEVHELFNTYYLKCDEIYGLLIVSGRRPGDRISIAGRNCTKSVKALYTENKMTQRQRFTTPILRDDRGPLVIPNLARSTRAIPSLGDRVIRVEFAKL